MFRIVPQKVVIFKIFISCSFLQLLTDSESGDKNYEQVHLHPLDIDLLQRSRHRPGATRPNRRRRSQDARPPIAPIKIKLRMAAATTSSTQPQPLKQSRGSSLSAVLAEIVREPRKKPHEEADTTTTLSVWTPSLKPAVAHPVGDETTNRRGLVETVASIREYYATEFCHQLLKEIAAEAILEAETHRQEEVDRDLKEDGSFGPSQSELGPESDTAIAIPACLSSGLPDRAEKEPVHEKLEGVATPCHPGTADEVVMNNTDEAKSSTGQSLDSALLGENQTLLSTGVADSSAEPPIVVKIAKIHVHPPEGSTSSNKAALVDSPSRALRSSASSQESVATAEKMTGQLKNEGSLKVVISPSKQTVLPPTKDSKTVLLKVKGRKLALEKGEVVSKGRKKLHSSIRKRKVPRGGRVVKRRRVRQRGKESVTEAVVPEKVSYVTVLKMSEIVSMRPAAAAGGGGGRGKIIQKLNSSMDGGSAINCLHETKSIAETTTEEILECGVALNAGKGETLLEKLPESESSPTTEGAKKQAQAEAPKKQAQAEAPELQRPEVPRQQQQTPEVPLQERPEVPKQPQPQEVSQLDSGCLPELEDEFIQDLPVLSYPPVPLPLSSSGLPPGTIPVAVEAKSGEISVGSSQENKKKKKKKAKKSPSPPPSKAQQLPVMRKSQAEIILAKIPPTAPAAAAAPLTSSRRGSSSSGSGQKNREHWVTSPPPPADFVARKSRPDETVTFCLPEGGFLRAPPTPLYRRVDELFGQYFPAEETTTLAEEKAFVETNCSSSALVSDVLSDLVETVCRVAQRSTGNQRVITAAPHQEWRSEESRPEEGNNREVESPAEQQPDGESSNNSTQCGQEADSGSKQENLPALGDFENKKIHESKGGNSDSQKVAVAELPEEQPAPASEETNGGQVRRVRKSSSLSESNTEETAAQARRNRMKHTGSLMVAIFSEIPLKLLRPHKDTVQTLILKKAKLLRLVKKVFLDK